MSLTFAPVDDYLVNVRQMVRKAPNVTTRRAFMRALREWCQQTQWLRVSLPGVTTAGKRNYNVGTDLNLDVIGIRAAASSSTASAGVIVAPLTPSDSTIWTMGSSPGQPRRFCYIPEGQFGLDPVPDSAYNLLITLIVTPRETAEEVPIEPLAKYSNDIEAGALAYLLEIPGQAWTDEAAAAVQARRFAAGIANGKTDVQRAYNTGSMRIRPRPFLMGSR